MVEQSPRLGLNTNYEQGEDNWSHNDTVNLVDELAQDRGPYSERPASGEYDGVVYLATDWKIAYQWDATNSVWDAVYGVGTSSNPLPEQHVQSLSADDATIGENIEMANDPYQLYVDPSGSDDADGTSGDPVATVGEALSRVPRISVDLVELRLSGDVHSVHEGIGRLWDGLIKFLPRSDANGTPVLESSNDKNAFWITGGYAVFEDVTIRPADGSTPYENAINLDRGRLRLAGSTHIVAGSDAGIETVRRGNGMFEVIDTVTIEPPSAGSQTALVSYGRSFGKVASGVTVSGGFTFGAWADRGAALRFGGTVDGATYGLVAQDEAAMKAAGATISADYAFRPEPTASIQNDGADISGSTNELDTANVGSYVEVASGGGIDRLIRNGVEKVENRTVSVPSGGVSSDVIPNASIGDALQVEATPANEPGNNVRVVAQAFRNSGDASGEVRFAVEELAGSGGGEARVVVYKDWNN